ncbi:MAG: acyl-CoA thioesterase [Myxococcales bacterium]|nr:acyl-CoA thioesterase [Myxococcales bacterium]
MAYTQRIPVRFDDVDYAQIVYFPRLFGYCHWVFEDFFAKEVGHSYAQVLSKRRIAFPTVHSEADFQAPLRFGDVCRVVMDTVKLSKRSIANRYRLYLGETQRLCAKLELVTVPVGLDDFKPVELPEDIRVAFLNHLVGLTV